MAQICLENSHTSLSCFKCFVLAVGECKKWREHTGAKCKDSPRFALVPGTDGAGTVVHLSLLCRYFTAVSFRRRAKGVCWKKRDRGKGGKGEWGWRVREEKEVSKASVWQ